MTSADHRPILIVEDSDEDFEAVLWVLEKSSNDVPIVRCRDGHQVFDYLDKCGTFVGSEAVSLPAIILLDLNLPGMDGHQVLTRIKSSERLKFIPVIVITTSARLNDVEACYRQGANSYVVKPVSLIRLRELIEGIVAYWFQLVLLPSQEGSHGG